MERFGDDVAVLTEDDVREIAKLARIAVDSNELAAYQHDLGRILELFETLSQVATDGIEPMAHPLELEQRLRPDTVTETDQRERFQAIAPAVADGLYLVPKVID